MDHSQRAFEGKLCRSVTRVLVGARPNVGQMEVPGSNVKGTAPKAQRKSAPANDGSSSASPKPKKSGQKVCSQQASQRKSDELRPKNRKDFTFGDRKAEEIRIRNKELRERLNRIKQRKPPSYKQNQVEIADFPPDDDTNGVEVDQISPTADGGCPLSRTEEDSIGGSRSLREEKEHEGEANTRPEHEGTSSSNPKVDGTNLHTPPASQHGEKMELPNGNKNNSSTRTLDELFAKVNDVEGKLGTLLGNRRHSTIENQVGRISAALPPNGVSTGVDFNKMAPAVNSVCPQCRTIEQNMFSEGRSLGKEKEHEGEATRANSSPEYQGKTLPKPSYYQIDGSSSAPPHHTGIGPNTYASPAPQCRKEEELPISENSILSYIVSAVDEFDSKYKYWSDQVREGKTLSNTQNEIQYLQRLTAEAEQIYSRPLASGPTGVSKGVGLNMITPTPDNVCSLLRAGHQDLFGKSQSLRKEEHEGGGMGAYGSPHYQVNTKGIKTCDACTSTRPEGDIQCASHSAQITSMVEGGSMSGTSNACSSGGECFKESLKARTLLEPANTLNGSSSSAPPYHTKISEEELLPNENSIWIYIIKGFNGCKAFYRYCKEVWNKAREIIHPLINTGVRTLLGPSNPHYDGNSSAPPDRRMKFCGEDLPPNEKLILTSIITAFDDCNAKYRYCSELLDKVQEIIPILNTESAVPHGHSNRFQTPEVTMKREDTPLNEEVSNDLELDVSAVSYSRSNDKNSMTSVDAVKYGGAKKGGNIGLKEEVSNVQDSAALAESRDGGSTADAAISSLNTERHGGSKKGKDIPSNDEVSKLISHKSNEFELDAPAGSYRRSTSVGNSISSVNAEASARMRSATRAGRKSVGGTSLYGQPGLRSKTQVEIRKNVKKYTFDERKLEELKNNNKSLAQRLKSIKERKSPLSWRSWDMPAGQGTS